MAIYFGDITSGQTGIGYGMAAFTHTQTTRHFRIHGKEAPHSFSFVERRSTKGWFLIDLLRTVIGE